MTGNESWPELVRQNFNSGVATKFTIFTGTHGNLGGQFIDSHGKIKDKYRDDSHTAQDNKTATSLRKELMGCDIKLIDIFVGNLRKPEELRTTAISEIAADRIVIFAWCYSIEAFKKVPSNIIEGEQSETDYVGARDTTEINDIVSDVFGSDLNEYKRPPRCKIEYPKSGDELKSDHYAIKVQGKRRY